MQAMSVQIPLITNLLRYFRIYWPYTRGRLIVLICLTMLSGFSESFGIALFMPILTTANITAQSSDRISVFFKNCFSLLNIEPSLPLLCCFVFIVFVARGCIRFFESAYTARLTALITSSVRSHVVQLFGDMDYCYFIKRDSGYFSNLVVMEAGRMVASFGRYCAVIIDLITISVFLIVSFWVNWQFTAATIVFAAVVLYCFKTLSARSRAYSLETSRQYAALHGLLIQTLHAFKYIKATASFSTLRPRLLATIGTISRLQFRTQLFGAVLSALTEPMVVGFILLLMLWQASIRGQSLAPLVVSIMLFYRISQYILSLQREWQQFSAYVGGVETITAATRDIKCETAPSTARSLTDPLQCIEFANVCFSYDKKEILREVSFTIKRNAMVALVGESGIGKTTLMDILTGVLSPSSGSVFVNNIPLHEINQADWRRKIGYVTQEPVVFNDTVANNICFWSCDPNSPACRERIAEAARKAYCDRFISELPQRYNTIIGDRGIKLSAGQRQRLAIARELFKQPELLILDEATSALDSESELFIQQSIQELKGTLTVILIAHRLSTIRNADYLFVLADGHIVEQGTFKELITTDGTRFQQMCRLQNITISE